LCFNSSKKTGLEGSGLDLAGWIKLVLKARLLISEINQVLSSKILFPIIRPCGPGFEPWIKNAAAEFIPFSVQISVASSKFPIFVVAGLIPASRFIPKTSVS
jgi:hypothetical protein